MITDDTAGLDGVLYVTAGATAQTIDLYRIELDPLRVTPLPGDILLSSIDGCGSELFVSGQVALGDQLFRLDGDTLRSVEGLERAHASLPAASFDCRYVAFDRPPFPRDRRFLVRVWDVERGRAVRTLSDTRPLGAQIWGPGDALTFLRSSGRARIVDGDVTRELQLPAGASWLKWSPRGALAVSTDDEEVFISDRAGGFTRVARGWALQDWSPDGRSVLLRRRRGAVLGVLDLGTPGVRKIAELDLPQIIQAEWLSESAKS